jgi:putative phosphoesterase
VVNHEGGITITRIVTFSDIHSNASALTNVLRDIEKQAVDLVYCLGDLVGYGPCPNTVIEILRNKKIPTVMGNYDEGIGYEKGECGCAYTSQEEIENGQKSIDWTTKATSDRNKEYLRSLLDKIYFEVGGYKVLLVHGSPRKINEYLFEDRRENSLRRIIDPLDIDVMICGHTHKPYHRIIDGVHIINNGSVGKPKDGDIRACYTVVEFKESIKVDFRRVDFPVENVASMILDVGLPGQFADDLRTGGQ